MHASLFLLFAAILSAHGGGSPTRVALDALRGNPPREPSFFRRRCEETNDALACVTAATMGPNAHAVSAEHVTTLDRDCRAYDRWSCWALAVAKAEGFGTARDEAGARAFWKRSCALDHAPSCANLAEDMKLLQRHCDQGWHSSCAKLAIRRSEDSLPEARDVAQKDCDQGGVESCAWLASDRDRRKIDSEPLWRKACEGNVAEACATLGVKIYYQSRDPRVVEDARRLFEQGCRLGAWSACADLGEMVRRGEGGPVDEARGVKLHTESCQRGYAPSCRALADLSYATNRGAAVSAMEKACDLKDGEACCRLAWLFGLGAGTKWQPLRAAGLWFQARRLGATLLCGLAE